ncbi:MAG: hypothetical protein KDI65_09935, partial [Alphaproteobacteria bacterium]|nr:hypothetical protein [Alphaproteobacteria bacterium]
MYELVQTGVGVDVVDEALDGRAVQVNIYGCAAVDADGIEIACRVDGIERRACRVGQGVDGITAFSEIVHALVQGKRGQGRRTQSGDFDVVGAVTSVCADQGLIAEPKSLCEAEVRRIGRGRRDEVDPDIAAVQRLDLQIAAIVKTRLNLTLGQVVVV